MGLVCSCGGMLFDCVDSGCFSHNSSHRNIVSGTKRNEWRLALGMPVVRVLLWVVLSIQPTERGGGGGWMGGFEGKKKFVYPNFWSSHFWLSIQSFIFLQRKIFLGFWVGGWFARGGGVRQTDTPLRPTPVDKHIPVRVGRVMSPSPTRTWSGACPCAWPREYWPLSWPPETRFRRVTGMGMRMCPICWWCGGFFWLPKHLGCGIFELSTISP